VKVHSELRAMVPTVGDVYLSKVWMGEDRQPLGLKVTRVAQGTVYVRPWYGLRDDGSEWLGAPSHFPVGEATRWLQ